MSDRIAVMRAGRIVQIGTGRDLYERPADAFVARFLGESNLLAGTRRAPSRASVRRCRGARGCRRRSRAAPAPGSRSGAAAALIRPETIRPLRRQAGVPARVVGARLSRRTRRAPALTPDAAGIELWCRRLAGRRSGRATASRSAGTATASRSCRKHSMNRGGRAMLNRRTSCTRGASAAAGPRRADVGAPRHAPGPAADILLLGRRAQRAGEDGLPRPVRQGQGDRGRPRLADELREAEGDGRGRRARMGPRRCRRALHLPGRGPARAARHGADPERQQARSRLGDARRASSPRRAPP